MIDVVLAFFAGLFLNWYGFGILCVLGILAEHNDGRGFAVFLALITGAVSFFFFNLTMNDLLVYAVAYLLIGFVWSFWRYRRFVIAGVELVKERHNNEDSRKTAVACLHPRHHVDTIVAWVIVWPFSAIENLTSDLINGIQTLVTKTFKAVYDGIWKSAVKDIL